MLRPATRDDLDALRALLVRANHAPYDINAVAEEKLFGDGVSGAPATIVSIEHDAIAGVAVTSGRTLRLLAVDPPHRRRGLGTVLLRDAEQRGATTVFAEAGNYFTPGIVENDTSTHAFFRKNGYTELRWTWNLHVPLRPSPRGRETVDAGRVRGALHEDARRVLAFIESEFGRIWRFEAEKAFARDAPPLFYAEVEGEVVGFAAYEVNNRGLSWFGPTGVAKELRGRGLGRELLLTALDALAGVGYGHAVIPWTDALDFYRRSCGAEPAHRFVTLTRV